MKVTLEEKIESILFDYVYVNSREELDIEKIRELMLCIYSEVETNFYIEVLESNDIDSNIISKYSSNEYDSSMFCQKGLKCFWDIEAKILKNKDYSLIIPLISNLFEWLQDLNWPGVNDISDLLLNIPKDDFVLNLEKSLKLAFF